MTGQIADPADAVFMLAMVREHSGAYEQIGYATAFFVSADGVALTNSHVVYAALRDPEHHQLLAVVDKEFYSVEIVCASRLTYDPIKSNEAPINPGRDVAEIRVVPAKLPIDSLPYRVNVKEVLINPTAHRGSLPPFPFLTRTIKGHPQAGSHVRAIGYGRVSSFPRKWTAQGLIREFWIADDGTETFDLEFSNPAQPGNSGSPVLDDHQQLIGILTWVSPDHSNLASAQSNDVLRRPCP